MVAIVLLFIATHLATAVHGGPSEEEVVSAIHEARRVNVLKRGYGELLKRAYPPKLEKRSGCPAMLSAYLGTKRSYNPHQARQSEDMLEATRLLVKRGFSLDELKTPEVHAVWKREFECTPAVNKEDCDLNTSIRTPDGSCNNLASPTRGMAGSLQKRGLATTAYGDGVNTPRTKSADGTNDLPSARIISRRVHSQNGAINSETLNLHMMGMGQFLDHDLGKTPEAEEIADCCVVADTNANCFNIPLRRNDNIQGGSDCMPFIRSKSAFETCEPDLRRQPNDITSWIDCSNIYGSSQTEQAALREKSGKGALLASTEINDPIYGLYNRLPDNPDDTACTLSVTGQKCSLCGDRRCNVVPQLTSYHEMGRREHNRIATALRPVFPDTDAGNEALFQRTRQIVIGEFQHIYYDEFLPTILSPDTMARYKLSSDETFTYDASKDGTMAVEFLTAAFRFHTWVSSRMIIFDQNLRPVPDQTSDQLLETNKATSDTFNNPEMTYYSIDASDPRPNRVRPPIQGLDGLLNWLSGAATPETDGLIVGDIQQRLFKEAGSDGIERAFDLAALNIQRGRDHGLPSYSNFRVYCGLSEATTSLPDHTAEMAAVIADAYNGKIEDCDLWTCAFTENRSPGSNVGPTLNCLIGKQFHDTKFGDRHWYQNEEAQSGFNAAQIAEIRKTSLARLLCDNMHYVRVMPKALEIRDTNEWVTCDQIPSMDLNVFVNPSSRPARDIQKLLEELKEINVLERMLEKLEKDTK